MSGIKEKLARWFLPAFMLASSITLLVVGVPRFLHELALVPGTPILHRLNAGEALTEEEWRTLEQSRLDALAFTELPDAYYDLGSSYLRRAQTATTPQTIQKYSEMAIEASMAGLKMAPLNTFAWFRVATANVMLGPDKYQDGLQAWRTSVKVARYEPSILLPRLHLGILLYQDMTPSDMDDLKSQLKHAYDWRRWDIILYAQKHNIVDWMIFLAEPESEMQDYLLTYGKK